MPRLLPGRGVAYSMDEGEGELMGYEPDLNDPVFYDDAIWVQCNTCDEYFDERKYNSRTCMVCEDREIREGKK